MVMAADVWRRVRGGLLEAQRTCDLICFAQNSPRVAGFGHRIVECFLDLILTHCEGILLPFETMPDEESSINLRRFGI